MITAGGQIGLKVPFMTTSGAVIPQTIQAATAAHITLDVASQFILNPKQNTTRAAMVAQLKKYAPGIIDTVSDGVVDAWLGPTLIAAAGNSGALKASRHRESSRGSISSRISRRAWAQRSTSRRPDPFRGSHVL